MRSSKDLNRMRLILIDYVTDIAHKTSDELKAELQAKMLTLKITHIDRDDLLRLLICEKINEVFPGLFLGLQ